MTIIRLDKETYEILYNLKIQLNKSMKDIIKEAILFYIQYQDKLPKEQQKIELGTECIFGYYTLKDGARDYECPILKKIKFTKPDDILKYCKLCHRRNLCLLYTSPSPRDRG